MKILFMGTPDFAVPCLNALCDSGHDVCGVFTQPDRPKGRGYTVTKSPVKIVAEKRGIEVFQPEKLRDRRSFDIISSLCPEAIVVVAYGNLLPREIIEFPKYGCINIHASLLPRWRGAAPIQWSIISGDTITGVTSMYMDEKLDTGDIIIKTETAIYPDETAGELHDRLSYIGSVNLVETLSLIEKNIAPRQKQDDAKSCYAPMLDKKIALIDFNKGAQEIKNLVRGLCPWPVAYAKAGNKTMKIYKADVGPDKKGMPGEVLGYEKGKGLAVCCGNGTIYIKEIQSEGGKRMLIEDYLRGHAILPQTVLNKED